MQHSLREDPSEGREPRPGAGQGSPPERPLRQGLLRMFGMATAVGLFLAFVGAFGLGKIPLLQRSLMILPYSWVGTFFGFICFRLLRRYRWAQGRPWALALLAGVVMTPPMCVVIWLAGRLMTPPGIPLAGIPEMSAITLSMCITMSLFAQLIRRRTEIVMVTAPGPAPPKFLERLPLKLRGAEVWAVEAEDHYLRLHTSKGQDLILMRLSDAVAELEGIEGAQVHRSWWVAREAIADAERGDGRATLTLKDGAEVPVSRTYARLLRERNWI